MSVDAIQSIGPVHSIAQTPAAAATSGVTPTQDPTLQALQLAQQEQMFSMLMQNTQSTLMSQSLQAPKDDEEDDA